jgi:hypothetical protein
MSLSHPCALVWSACHAVIACLLGAFDMFISFGYSLSDAYHDPDGWLVVIDRLVLILEAPVALVLKLLYNPAPRFAPPRLFLVDYLTGSNGLLVFALCVLWSVTFGYACAFLAPRFKAAWAASRAASREQAEQRHVDACYKGARCVSCRAPIEPNARICPACGWTQPS